MTQWATGGDILSDIRALFDTLPPPPFFASSVYFPTESAVSFEVKRRRYVGAHPKFWDKIPPSTATPPPLSKIEIVDLDTDTKARAVFFDAMAEAMSNG